jgi:Cu(I)/Ag(I) efflux system membrane protein CusA/SilA
MWATGTGADVMKRLAAPMVGGVCSAMLLTLFVIPAVYVLWRWQTEVKREGAKGLEQNARGGHDA